MAVAGFDILTGGSATDLGCDGNINADPLFVSDAGTSLLVEQRGL